MKIRFDKCVTDYRAVAVHIFQICLKETRVECLRGDGESYPAAISHEAKVTINEVNVITWP